MSTLSIIFPLLFMASLGYLLTAKGPFTKEHIAGISLFTFYICIPAFLFINMYQADLGSSFDTSSLCTFYLPVIAVYGLSAGLYYYLSPRETENRSNSAVYALGCSYSNTILVGLPIIVGALGEVMMGKVFAIITFHSALLFSLTFILSSKQKIGVMGAWNFSKGIIFNPIVLSISTGLILNLLQVPLEHNLTNGLRLLSEPALACALFVLGANLVFYKVAKGWHLALIASVIKLLLLPLCVYAIGRFAFSVEGDSLALLVLLSASPLGVNAYLVAMQVQAQQALIASTVVMSTVLSVFTMSLWLTILL
ncbi:AEC family transporter [Shewanella schlegeliana]|uniref:AEC family transporter n=1 Tax=Shewanella schlegeliana TaxID=190308 RepID=A0ABS1T2V3_9GAMM|nr:AEC family transporter [Shewanella schlegeliana]MBL4915134.1 AEC family transporter [Shewanella schlegeliana]MCL1110999.1 AEC family transporter [Shewanella schlegeliana]GIU29274.1 malonate transporter [Shewanella schlegeliana]